MSHALVDDLKAKFPFFEYKNRLNVPKSLFLADGEEIVVPANGSVKVASSNVSSFPDFSVFEYVSPKMEDLDEFGMLERKSKPANARLHEDDGHDSPSPAPIASPDPDNKPNVDGNAAGNQTVKSPTSPNVDTTANLETKGGSNGAQPNSKS